jgi:hypothetical protein
MIDTLLFLAGMLSGFVVHEAGHELVARAYGEELIWKNGSWICTGYCEHLEQVAIAGNAATAIAGEIAVNTGSQGYFTDGFIAFAGINQITYYAADALNNGYKDYANVDDDTVKVALAIHGATLLHRRFGPRLWPTPNGFAFGTHF